MKDLTKAEELMLLTIMRLKDNAYGVSIKRKINDTIGKNYAGDLICHSRYVVGYAIVWP